MIHFLWNLDRKVGGPVRQGNYSRGSEMDGAGSRGKKPGRPKVTDRPGFEESFGAILERLNDDSISRRRAARELNIGYATLKRLLDSGYPTGGLD